MSRTGAVTDQPDTPLFIPGAPAPFVFTLPQVHYLTGWSVRSLLDDCRDGRIEHVNRKGTYGMTAEQIEAAVEVYTREATAPVNARLAAANEAEQARIELATAMAGPRGRAKRAA
jgi:hypothetical protein